MPARRRTRAASKRTPSKRARGPRTSRRLRRGKAPRRPARLTATREARDIKAHAAAVKRIGAERLRPGPVRVTTTRALTPTKRGFKSLEKTLTALQRSQRLTKRESFFSWRLEGSYRDPTGRLRRFETRPAGFPTQAAVRAGRRKGESEAAAFRRLTLEGPEVKGVGGLRGAVFRSMREDPRYQAMVGRLVARRKPRHAIREAINEYKQLRKARFKVVIERED